MKKNNINKHTKPKLINKFAVVLNENPAFFVFVHKTSRLNRIANKYITNVYLNDNRTNDCCSFIHLLY